MRNPSTNTHAVIKRANRRIASHGLTIHKARFYEPSLGEFYAVDNDLGMIAIHHLSDDDVRNIARDAAGWLAVNARAFVNGGAS